jgi:hypothetical protein
MRVLCTFEVAECLGYLSKGIGAFCEGVVNNYGVNRFTLKGGVCRIDGVALFGGDRGEGEVLEGERVKATLEFGRYELPPMVCEYTGQYWVLSFL